LGDYNFYNCTSLKAIIINNSTPPTFHGYSTNDDFTGVRLNLRTWFGNDTV
jgi:hypothetical protein